LQDIVSRLINITAEMHLETARSRQKKGTYIRHRSGSSGNMVLSFILATSRLLLRWKRTKTARQADGVVLGHVSGVVPMKAPDRIDALRPTVGLLRRWVWVWFWAGLASSAWPKGNRVRLVGCLPGKPGWRTYNLCSH